MLDPIYKELQWFESDSPSVFVLQIKSSYFLVSMVDNDYIHGDLFSVFAAL
jgi:methylenetetrahydrofolate reductase (NADPH)